MPSDGPATLRDRAAPLSPSARLPEDAPAVECRDLVVRYGERTAVDRLSLRAHAGQVLCILGPNGAGKTSTVECLEGYRRPASGTVRVLGLDPVSDHRAVVARIGVMLQRGGVYPMLAPRRALHLFASYFGDPEDPDALLDLVQLRPVARTPWRHLSGGEQARLSLALALVGKPDVVFLDEPTAGVDPEGRLGVREIVAGLRERGVCVVLTTHELDEAERLADRVVVLRRGRVVAEGTPDRLAQAAGGGEELTFGAAAGLDTAALGLAVRASVDEGPPGRYHARAEGAGAVGELAAAVTGWLARQGIAFSDIRVGRSLEEAYLAVLREDDGEEPAPANGSGAAQAGGDAR